MTHRRRSTRAIASLTFTVIALSAPAAAPGAERGFEFGVVAADVGQHSAILWARADRTGKALAQIARGRRFGACDIGRAPARLEALVSIDRDKTVQKRIDGLQPGTNYRYRWCMSGGRHKLDRQIRDGPGAGPGEDDPLRPLRRPGRRARARADAVRTGTGFRSGTGSEAEGTTSTC